MNNPAEIFIQLDAISRKRALTNAESMKLERALKAIEEKRRNKFHWTPSRVQLLKHMIEIEGMTFAQAGAALGCTKNACLGKYSRENGWAGRQRS